MHKILTTLTTLTLMTIIVFGVQKLVDAQSDEGLLVSSAATGVEANAQREILSLLIELRSISIDDELFQSKVFRSLKDFGVVLEPKPVGRPNPFAPVGFDEEEEEVVEGSFDEDLTIDEDFLDLEF